MFQASDVDQDTKSRRELNVASKISIFEVQLEQKQFTKAKRVEKTMAEKNQPVPNSQKDLEKQGSYCLCSV